MADRVDGAELPDRGQEGTRQDRGRYAADQGRPKQRECQRELNRSRRAKVKIDIEPHRHGRVGCEQRKCPLGVSPFFDRGPHQRDGGSDAQHIQRADAEWRLTKPDARQIQGQSEKNGVVHQVKHAVLRGGCNKQHHDSQTCQGQGPPEQQAHGNSKLEP